MDTMMVCRDVLPLEEEDDKEEDCFFDSREDLSSASDSGPNSPVDHNPADGCLLDQQFQLWIEKPGSMEERRNKFRRCMGLSFSSNQKERQASFHLNSDMEEADQLAADVGRLSMSDSGSEIRSSNTEIGYSMSSRSSASSNDCISEDNVFCRFKNLNDSTVFFADELGQDGNLTRSPEDDRDRLIIADESNRSLGSSPLVRHALRRQDNISVSSTSSDESSMRKRSGLLKRLGLVASGSDREEDRGSMSSDLSQDISDYTHRIRVHRNKKQSKEYSAVYMRQDFKAHDGGILTMKFSPDGQYLASGGEDGIVRVWHVKVREWIDERDLPGQDPSCLYFMANDKLELGPICITKGKRIKSKGMKITSHSACVVIPPKFFQLSDRPLHEFYGHGGDILDLSWSTNKCILSSSIDHTVRLWQVGCDTCLQVFPHSDYVTCVQFNPLEENLFISGSIDGKVRIWSVSCGHVVDWIDAADIVTAACYAPDGKGVVVGSVTGTCRFYCITDNHLQLDTQLFLRRKKKSSGKMIVGFQFSPVDPNKLLVTSADSRVRILSRRNVVGKYKGLRNTRSRISASFTKCGTHIISASEDSHIYIWNHASEDGHSTNHLKSTSSYERFFSKTPTVAIEWRGFESSDPISLCSLLSSEGEIVKDSVGNNPDSNRRMSPSSGSLTSSHGFLAEIFSKGSATWPEEKLPSSSVAASLALGKSEYKFLRSCCENAVLSPHAWDQVIVTGGCDGRIRAYQNYGFPFNH